MKLISSVLVISALVMSTVSAKEGDMYVGLQSSYPAYGASFKYDISDKISAQAVLGGFGTLGSYSVRGIYKFKQQDHWNIYGFGSVGLLTWKGYGYHEGRYRNITETSFSFGGGAGLEWDWQKWLKNKFRFNFVPLYSTAEVGFATGGFDYYDYTAAYVGVGLHYKF